MGDNLRMDGIENNGETGFFLANASMMGWREPSSGRTIQFSCASVTQAEWLEGKLRILSSDMSAEIVALDGFNPADFDKLWRHFQAHCGVYIKQHKRAVALYEQDFDAAMSALEDHADGVDDAGSLVQKRARENDLMKLVENVRDGLDQAVAGDREALSRVFSANGCERIGRLRLVIDTVQLEGSYEHDARWAHLRSNASTIEGVLRELGTFRPWKPAAGASASLARREIVRELRASGGGRGPGEAAGLKDAGGAQALVEDTDAAPPRPETPPSDTTVVPAPTAPLAPGPPAAKSGGRGSLASTGPRHDSDSEEEEEEAENRASRPPGTLSTRAPAPAQEGITQDWIWKRSRMLKQWRRRWLVLSGEGLSTFKTKPAPGVVAERTELIPPHQILNVTCADSELRQQRSLAVHTTKRTYYLICDDAAKKDEWMKQILLLNDRGARR